MKVEVPNAATSPVASTWSFATGLFVPMGLLGLLTVPGEIGTIWNAMVAEPWAFVVDRPLGQCDSVTVDY